MIDLVASARITEDLDGEVSDGLPLQCAPGVILHGILAGYPVVSARVLNGGVLRGPKHILVDIWAVLNQTRTRLVEFLNIGECYVNAGSALERVTRELRSAGVHTTVEVSGTANATALALFDIVRVSIVPDLRVAPAPHPQTLAAAHEIRALIRSDGDLKSLEAIIATAPVRVGDGPDRTVVTLDLAFSGHPPDERALYELAKTSAFTHGWRLSPTGPQPRRSF